jgi:SAM-dependent MidA family methyltransferase
MAISFDLEIKKHSLTSRLRARIEQQGPISFRDWMAVALYDEHDGYYCRAAGIRQGRAGDYRTAPESSPLFAATFARYFSQLFFELGAPSSWTIIEVGAGSGEFAHGVLTALQARHPGILAATTYLIDEISNAARLRIADRLTDFADRVRYKRLSEFSNPAGAGVVFSNELVDALPVQRITMRAGRLREICVGVDQENFVWVECDPDKAAQDYCERIGLQLAEGQIADVNLDAEDYLARAAATLERGFMITVDYGAERDELLKAPHRHEGTLRAFRRHELIDDVLASPGTQDLTTTIDWTQIREAGARAGLETLRHERLDQFLFREGIIDELEMVANKMTDLDALRLRTSAREMIMPHGLAAFFQVLVQKKHP